MWHTRVGCAVLGQAVLLCVLGVPCPYGPNAAVTGVHASIAGRDMLWPFPLKRGVARDRAAQPCCRSP